MCDPNLKTQQWPTSLDHLQTDQHVSKVQSPRFVQLLLSAQNILKIPLLTEQSL